MLLLASGYTSSDSTFRKKEESNKYSQIYSLQVWLRIWARGCSCGATGKTTTWQWPGPSYSVSSNAPGEGAEGGSSTWALPPRWEMWDWGMGGQAMKGRVGEGWKSLTPSLPFKLIN